MSALLREWNDASKPRRKKLLEWFRDQFQWTHFRGEFERECGADVALFLARILVWMQKTTSALPAASEPSMTTTATCFALSDQLACIQLFFTSANIHAYYREFQQADGLALLLRVLGSPRGQSDGVGVSDADRAVILDILHRISQRGRSHKEEISRHGGELAMIRGALAGSQACNDMNSTLWTLCRDALLEQLVGNPNSLDQVHGAILFMLQHPEAKVQIFGAQILRHLITPDSFYVDLKYRNAKAVELVALGMAILQSSGIHLQHEGLELVHSLLQNGQLQVRM
uniref:Uncharacterized protein n=1 Tax=Globisporangium ultimum (strain ATCC 200006 / CBS 805.95 / DAOM BR144) TaxID=431595 RepID=K3X4B2_GLOUD